MTKILAFCWHFRQPISASVVKTANEPREAAGTCLASAQTANVLSKRINQRAPKHGEATGTGRTNNLTDDAAVNRRRHRMLRDANDMLGTASLAFVLAGLLTGMVGAITMLQSLPFGPPVGEILRFGPYDGWTPVWQIDAVRSSDQRHCVLKPAVMAASHGSMVVEQRLGDGRTFAIHWAGGATSNGAANCGRTTDLLVGLTAMQTLLNAAAAGQHWPFVGS